MSAPALAPAPARAFHAVDVGLFGTIVLIWGTTWLAVKWQLGTVDPQVSLLWRFLIAAPIMFAVCGSLGQRLAFPLRVHALLALTAALMFSTNFILFYNAGRFVVSGLLGVIFALSSITSIALSAVFLGDPIRARVMLGALIGLGGVALLFWPEIANQALGRGPATSLALGLAGTLSFCLGSMVSLRLQRGGVPVASITAWGLAYGVLINAGVAVAAGSAFAIDPAPRYLGSLLLLAVPGTVLASWIYLTLMARIGADRAAYTTVLSPALALLVSSLIEDYRWTPLAFAGLALVVAGNVLVLTQRSRG